MAACLTQYALSVPLSLPGRGQQGSGKRCGCEQCWFGVRRFLGKGNLGGRGVYASRAFEEADVVVSYDLRPLTGHEYLALSEDERRFVHSYWGERWLYPSPARYVNVPSKLASVEPFRQKRHNASMAWARCGCHSGSGFSV